MLKILLILWLFPYVAIDLSAFQHFYRLRTMSRVCFFLSFPWSISNSSMTAGITVRRQGYYVHDIPGKQKYKNSCYFQFYFFFICCVSFFFFIHRERRRRRKKEIYLSLSAVRRGRGVGVISRWQILGMSWLLCTFYFIYFLLFVSFEESGACRTGNPSRPAPDDNDILRSSCVSSCERKFLDGDNQKHLSAFLIPSSFYFLFVHTS